MPGTKQTLFDAFRLSEQQGLGGSPLQQALGVFGGNDPRPDPLNIGTTPSSGQIPFDAFTPTPTANPIGQQQSNTPGIFRRIGETLETAKPIFSGASFLDTVLPGDPGTAIKEKISDVPVVGGFSAEVLDNVFSPATLLVAARGVQAASLLGRLPVAGKFAGALVDPILRTGSFGARMGVETGAIIGGVALGKLTEDAPFPVQLAASLGGALIGARQGVKIFGDVADPAVAVKAVTEQLHPTGTIAEIARLDGAIDDLKATELSAIDEQSRQLRAAVMDAAAHGGGVYQLPANAKQLADDHWKLLTARELHDVEQLPSLMTSSIENVRPIEGLLGWIGSRGRMSRSVARIFNGNVGRNANGRAVSEVAFNYAQTGVVNAGNAETLVKGELDTAFGPKLEKLVLKDSLVVDEVDARRLAVLEDQLAGANKEYERIREQMSTLGKNRGALAVSGLEDYGILERSMSDQGEMAGRLAQLRSQRDHLANEVSRIKGGEYGDPETAERALADARKFLRQYRDGYLQAAPDQDLATHSQLLTLVAENQSLFSLTPEQKEFFDAYAEFQDFDLKLNGAFNIDIDPVDNYYVHHVSDWFRIGDDGKLNTINRNELTNIFAERTLAQRRGFQFPRTFQNSLDWMRALDSAKNPAEWNARLDKAIEGARAKGDLEEVARLEDLKSANIVPIPRQQHFAATIAGRMAESYGARAEALAKAVADEFGSDVRKEVDDLLINSNVSDLIRKPAEAAGFLRSTLLRLDLSMAGVQGLSGAAVLSGPNAGMREFADTLTRVIGSDAEFAKWWLLNGDRLSYWSMNGIVFAPSEINVVTSGLDEDLATHILTLGKRGRKEVLDPDTGKAVTMAGGAARTAGKDKLPVGGWVKTLDKLQFARGITMMKAYTAEHLYSLAKVAKNDEDFLALAKQGFPFLASKRAELASMSDQELGRFIAEFVNDIYGGRNRVMLGRTQAHQMVEALLALTPGFTRGTLHQAVNTFKPGVKGALARDYAMRSMMIAGGIVSLLTAAFNGIEFENGKPKVVTPNLFDPSADDWFDIPLPGGRTIRPMSRFRGIARIVAGSLQEAAINGNWEKATQYWTDDAVRWFTYRQSALISTVGGDPVGEVFGEQRGNSFARNGGMKDILFNPSTNRALDIREHIIENYTPIFGQTVLDQAIQMADAGSVSAAHFREIGVAAGSELLGVGTFGPTMLESNVTSRTAELAIAAGMDADAALDLARRGRSALWARDDQNRYLLDSDTRQSIIAALAAEFQIPEDVAARGGARNDRERRMVAEGVKDSQLGRFTEALDAVNAEYRERVTMLEAAMTRGAITPAQFSEELTKLRIRRAGARSGAEQASPAAIMFLESDARNGSQNANDQIFSAISQEAFSEDFIDPETGTFDFDAQEEHYSNLEAKYGDWFYQWQANRDKGKSAIELQRDTAYRTLSPYFDVADEAWVMTTGGALGASEREFDRSLNEMLLQSGVPQEYLALARSAMKQNIPAVTEYRTVTQTLRQAMRAMNPEVDAAAQIWLGAMPLGIR